MLLKGAKLKISEIPEPTIMRLTVYARCLTDLVKQNVQVVSSEKLANEAGVNAAQVRKDLSYLGSFGRRGVGYETNHLLNKISICLGLTKERSIVIVGVGKLGSALLGYQGFLEKGFKMVAAFDTDKRRIGSSIGGIEVIDLERVDEIIKKKNVEIGIIAVPAEAAQKVVDRLVVAGIKSILNFAPVVIKVPESILLRRVDLSSELEILSHYLNSTHKE